MKNLFTPSTLLGLVIIFIIIGAISYYKSSLQAGSNLKMKTADSIITKIINKASTKKNKPNIVVVLDFQI